MDKSVLGRVYIHCTVARKLFPLNDITVASSSTSQNLIGVGHDSVSANHVARCVGLKFTLFSCNG